MRAMGLAVLSDRARPKAGKPDGSPPIPFSPSAWWLLTCWQNPHGCCPQLLLPVRNRETVRTEHCSPPRTKVEISGLACGSPVGAVVKKQEARCVVSVFARPFPPPPNLVSVAVAAAGQGVLCWASSIVGSHSDTESYQIPKLTPVRRQFDASSTPVRRQFDASSAAGLPKSA